MSLSDHSRSDSNARKRKERHVKRMAKKARHLARRRQLGKPRRGQARALRVAERVAKRSARTRAAA